MEKPEQEETASFGKRQQYPVGHGGAVHGRRCCTRDDVRKIFSIHYTRA